MSGASGAHETVPLEEAAARQVAALLGLPFVDLRSYRVSAGVLSKLPLDVAEKLRCVPLLANRRRLVLVTDDPARAVQLTSCPEELGYEECSRSSRRRLELALTTPGALDEALARRRLLAR